MIIQAVERLKEDAQYVDEHLHSLVNHQNACWPYFFVIRKLLLSRKRKLAELYDITVCRSGRPQDAAHDLYFKQLQAFQDANDLQKYVQPSPLSTITTPRRVLFSQDYLLSKLSLLIWLQRPDFQWIVAAAATRIKSSLGRSDSTS